MLKGEKVILRPTRREDVSRLNEFNQDIELYGLNSTFPNISSLEKALTDFDAWTNKPDENSAWFAIEADDKYIGNCCLIGLNNRHGNLELGIVIGDRSYWGRGYGREAVGLLLKYGFHYLGARRIVLTSHEKNERAIRCFQACGFVEEGRPRKAIWIEGEYIDLVNMSVLREEWLARGDNDHNS
jgi:RimJ/RimL family protein N-acetyltransferase